jgi:hypothetical protein
MRPVLPHLLAATLLLSACANQPPGGDRGDEGPGTARRGGPTTAGEAGGSPPHALLQEQLRQTAEALALTPRQLPLWDTYQEKVGALLADQMKLPPYRARQTAPQQIAVKLDTVRNRLAAMEDIQEAASRLYAALDEPQKALADRMLAGTVPALYSGLATPGESGGRGRREGRDEREGNGAAPGSGTGSGRGRGPGRL